MAIQANVAKNPVPTGPSVGSRIIEGLEEAIAWSRGEDVPVRVTQFAKHPESVEDVLRGYGEGFGARGFKS